MKWLKNTILLFFLGVFFWSCDKREDLLGTNIIEQKEIGLIQFDTLRVEAYTKLVDSIPALNTRYSLAGTYVDPTMGKTTAGFYTQCLLPSSNIDFGTGVSSADLDSIVLNIKYFDAYGDTLDSQTLKVFEMTEKLESTGTDPDDPDQEVDLDIFTDDEYTVDNNAIGEKTFFPMMGNTGDNNPSEFNTLQIRLSDDFGKKIMDASGSANLADNESFVDFMKGLYVVGDNPAQGVDEGSILSFDLLDSESNMMLYYAGDSLEFKISTSALRVNHFDHDYSGTDVQNQIDNKPAQPEFVYLQSMAGTQFIIDLPTAYKLFDSNYVINEARLELPVSGETPEYNTFSRVYLKDYTENDEGELGYLSLVDRGAEYYNGTYDEEGGFFKFNIARHLNKIINEGYSTKFYVRQEFTGYAYDMRRAIINGPGHSEQPMRLVLLVSKLN